jgi:16S rRNA (adenine1518-N6/adenine1519-N6)-dimethyltransferase
VKNPKPATVSPLLGQTLGLLRRYDIRAKKGLGQHFLIDSETLDKIITAAELSSADTVVEIGPGLGVLTERLAEKAGRVIAIELDNSLAARLSERLASLKNVTVLNEDVLKVDPASLFEQKAGDYKVVANLPYYITSPVLRHFLEASIKPRTMVVMVKKEVAKQITAAPGQLSILAVSVQLYAKPALVTIVPAAAFYPAPKIDSAVIRIDVYPGPVAEVTDPDDFFVIVRAGFKAARKQIHNSLERSLELTKEEVAALLAGAGIDPERRAQTLTLEEWARLWQIYRKQSVK